MEIYLNLIPIGKKVYLAGICIQMSNNYIELNNKYDFLGIIILILALYFQNIYY